MISKINNKPAGDLHTKKDSHMSVALTGKQEFHIRNEDANMDTKDGQQYLLCFPVLQTSSDEEARRCTVVEKPFFTKYKGKYGGNV